MRVQTLRGLLRASPFRPFTIHLSDGSRLPVPHPEFASASHGQVVVAQAVGWGGRRQRTTTCDALHVTRIEVIEG
jgi:hypothetical protein